jgi:IS5 family transposase
LEKSLTQSEWVRKYIGGTWPKIALTDRVEGNHKLIKHKYSYPNRKETSQYQQELGRIKFKDRAAI